MISWLDDYLSPIAYSALFVPILYFAYVLIWFA